MNIFVGNLSFDSTESDVKKLFDGLGSVAAVVIVMEKGKNPKSRGFGFVDMPDEQQALAAIAALNAKEFMGRALNVNPARPKTEAERKSELEKKLQLKKETKAKQHSQEEGEQKKTWFAPVFYKPGSFKGGRRSQSYRKSRGVAGMQEEARPRRRPHDNPMRWRKRKDQPKSWQKSQEEHKPWEKAEGEARPWKKPAGDAKPWRKSEGGSKPWRTTSGESKPWKKAEEEARPWKKPEGKSKPWKKAEGEARPWKKAEGKSKPWSKSSARPQKSRFKVHRKPPL